MVNVWKMGAWPGFPGIELSLKNKNEFINKYALPNNFVAIGFKDCKAEGKTEEEIKEICKNDCSYGNYWGKCSKEFINFTKNIKYGDIILLYNYGQVYTGIAQKRDDGKVYYETKEIPKHRIDVKWLYDKKSKRADFSKWQDTVHQLEREDIDKIKDKELKECLNKNFT
jgi:hypothetical protein